jgi:hypothetical protein
MLERFSSFSTRDVNPLLDLQYWQLLAEIVAPASPALASLTKTPAAARPTRVWLAPLVHRISFASLVSGYFRLSISLPPRDKTRLEDAVYPSLSVIWPLASPRFASETLQDCFGAALVSVHASLEHPTNQQTSALLKTFTLIVASYRSSVSNASNRKKVSFVPGLLCARCQRFHAVLSAQWIVPR